MDIHAKRKYIQAIKKIINEMQHCANCNDYGFEPFDGFNADVRKACRVCLYNTRSKMNLPHRIYNEVIVDMLMESTEAERKKSRAGLP